MQHHRFDALVHALAALLDRRQTVGAFLALLAALALGGDDMRAKKKGGKKGKGGKGGGKGKGKGKKKKKRRRSGGGSATRNCDEVALQPNGQGVGADLRACDLREHPDLANANFTNAKLEDSVLSGADLSGVSFRGARLWRVKLDGATLNGADFRPEDGQKTDIFETDFTDANLLNADLDLDQVYYSDYAFFCNTTMPDGSPRTDDDCPA